MTFLGRFKVIPTNFQGTTNHCLIQTIENITFKKRGNYSVFTRPYKVNEKDYSQISLLSMGVNTLYQQIESNSILKNIPRPHLHQTFNNGSTTKNSINVTHHINQSN